MQRAFRLVQEFPSADSSSVTYSGISGLFTAIAEAIREKTGDTASIVADTFPDFVLSIGGSSGGDDGGDDSGDDSGEVGSGWKVDTSTNLEVDVDQTETIYGTLTYENGTFTASDIVGKNNSVNNMKSGYLSVSTSIASTGWVYVYDSEATDGFGYEGIAYCYPVVLT